MQENNILNNKYYRRPWGKHKDSCYSLIYNSGSYGEILKVKQGKIMHRSYILLKDSKGVINADNWAKEHNYKKVNISDTTQDT